LNGAQVEFGLESKVIEFGVAFEQFLFDVAAQSRIEGILRVGLAGDHLRTITERGTKKEDLLKALKRLNINVRDIVVGEPTLEDVFISLAR